MSILPTTLDNFLFIHILLEKGFFGFFSANFQGDIFESHLNQTCLNFNVPFFEVNGFFISIIHNSTQPYVSTSVHAIKIFATSSLQPQVTQNVAKPKAHLHKFNTVYTEYLKLYWLKYCLN